MKADATAPIMGAHAQVSYLRDEKNVSFRLMRGYRTKCVSVSGASTQVDAPFSRP